MSEFSNVMPLADLLEQYTPGDEWSWEKEAEWLYANHRWLLEELADSIQTVGFENPVLLGNDGRVWDGHHRIIVSKDYLKLSYIPIRKADD